MSGATYWHQTPQVHEKPIHEYVSNGRNAGYKIQGYYWSDNTGVIKYGIWRDGKQIGMAKTLREAKVTVERLVENNERSV